MKNEAVITYLYAIKTYDIHNVIMYCLKNHALEQKYYVIFSPKKFFGGFSVCQKFLFMKGFHIIKICEQKITYIFHSQAAKSPCI